MRFEQLVVFILGPLAGYLLGSIPFALVIGLANGVDIRKVGSRNIGATNLGRTLGTRFFMHAFLLDAAKGMLPTLALALLVHSWNNHPGQPHLGGDGQAIEIRDGERLDVARKGDHPPFEIPLDISDVARAASI
ncbi:MAG: glycerol-3-phosphate acyltransferase [Phycisphaerae bacterium]